MKKHLLLLFMCGMLIGCSSAVLEVSDNEYNHIISLDNNGDFVKFSVGSLCPAEYDWKSHVDAISKEAKGKEVVLYIHGGMKPLEESLEEAKEILASFKADTNNQGKHLIVVNWESDMLKSYCEHVRRIRQGEVPEGFWDITRGHILTPFYFVADLGRAVMRAPITWTYQWEGALPGIQDHRPKKVLEGCLPRKNYTPENSNPKSEYTQKNTICALTRGIVPGILRIVTTPLLDGIGKAAWKNMLRRTEVVFASNVKPEDKRHHLGGYYNDRQGGLSALMNQLTKDEGAKFTLIGHSMGCIIFSNMLKLYPKIKCEKIIFMGAACPVMRMQDVIIPYLKRNIDTNFWNLSLHPYGDRQEDLTLSILPKGSLLDWLDDYAMEPESRMFHTLGKWNNLMRCLPIILNGQDDSVLGRIHLKRFKHQKGYPQTHGSFNDFQFWKENFLNPEDTSAPDKIKECCKQ